MSDLKNQPMAYTITIKPYTQFKGYFSETKYIYKKAPHIEQFQYVKEKLKKTFKSPYKLTAEEHKNGALHYHGILYAYPEAKEIYNNQLNKVFGRSSISILKTHEDLIRWNKYIEKEHYLYDGQGDNRRDWNMVYKDIVKGFKGTPLDIELGGEIRG